MPSPAAVRNALVRLLVRTVWGVRAFALERPTTRAVLRAIGRPAIWMMHRTAGKAPPGAIHDPQSEPVLNLPLGYAAAAATPAPNVAFLVHAAGGAQLADLAACLERSPFPAPIFATTDTEAMRAQIESVLGRWPGGLEVRVLPQARSALAAQLVGLADVLGRFDYGLFLQALAPGAEEPPWRRIVGESLLRSPEAVRGVFEAFARLPELGLVAPRIPPGLRPKLAWHPSWRACRDLADRLGFALAPDSPVDFPVGGMFWARTAALKPLLALGLAFDAFDANAIERLVFYACERAGLRWIRAGADVEPHDPEGFFYADTPLVLRRCLTDFGRTVLLPGRPPNPTRNVLFLHRGLSAQERKTAFRAACRFDLDDFVASGAPLVLPTSERPEVSIILVLFNQAELTFQCLKALRHALDRPSEVIVIDNASSDDTGALLQRLQGATIVRNTENLHFLRAVNQAGELARGEAVLLLNNDARVRPGSIGAAWERLQAEQDLGAVGGRIVLLDGTLQEAGSIIWRDGSCAGYARGADPEAGEFQFRRDVDYASGAFLLIRRAAFEALGRLDTAFAPAYYEETDFCMRLWEAGYRIAYEPRVLIWHFEFGSASSSEAAIELQRRHQVLFAERHAKALAAHLAPGAPQILARAHGDHRRRLLLLEDQIPYPQLGAGFPRARDLLQAAHAAGWFVTLYPVTFPDADYAAAYDGVVPPDVEIAAERGVDGLAPFLRERRGYYDAVIASRPHNMQFFRAALAEVPDFIAEDRIVYDAEAIFATRDLATSPGSASAAAIRAEAAIAAGSAAVFAVNEAEAAEFRAAGARGVHVLGHAVEPCATRPGFEARQGLLFVGALDEDNSPNVDSLVFFVEAVAPRLDALIGATWTLTVAGRNGSPRARALACDRVRLLGRVPDLKPLYARSRLFVAPTRFAAGIPMKVHEAAAHGLPTVATALLGRQLGWRDGDELLVADDPEAFAAACARLCQDAALWARIRRGGLAAVRRDCSPERFRATVAETLDGVAPSPQAASSSSSRRMSVIGEATPPSSRITLLQ